MGRYLFDIHCHVIPGVDDGASGLEESVWMLRKQYEDGVRCVIATPHFRYDMFEPSEKLVREQFERTRAEAEKIGIRLFLGCELHSSMDMVDCLRAGKRRTMAGSRYVLLEFGNQDEQSYMRERVQALIIAGYTPIIAHAERYKNFRKGTDFARELRGMGARIQCNTDSITGRDGGGIRRFCRSLAEEDLIDFVGSDGHDRKKRIPALDDCFRHLEKTYGIDYARRLFTENPLQIFAGLSSP